jgi:hypothetical protein
MIFVGTFIVGLLQNKNNMMKIIELLMLHEEISKRLLH